MWLAKIAKNITVNGKSYKQKTTRGWQLCIEWKDKPPSWERLSDMKESYPVEVSEYAETCIVLVNSSCLEKETEDHSSSQQEIPQVDNKFRIKVPKTVEEALALDKENGNGL